MKCALFATVLALASPVFGLDGQIGIHDPSTIVQSGGRFYTYSTGGSSLVSDDGWTRRRGDTLPRRGLALDIIHLGRRCYVCVARSSDWVGYGAAIVREPCASSLLGGKIAWTAAIVGGFRPGHARRPESIDAPARNQIESTLSVTPFKPTWLDLLYIRCYSFG